jgi:hypothetical protein
VLQFQRVKRPLPLPRPHHKQPLLMAEAAGDVEVLADALTRQLLQRRGCASVSEASGAMQQESVGLLKTSAAVCDLYEHTASMLCL